MAAFDRIKSGIPGLDEALDNIRLGDNVVWNVTNLNEFSYFVDPYVKQAKEDNRNLIYIRFANHPPLIEMTEDDFKLLEIEENNPETEFCMIERDGIKIYKVNPYNQFETFTLEVHRIIEKEGFDAFYVFDCLSDLQAVWSTDLMMGNFFKVTCPFLFQLDTVAYFPIIRGRHSFDAIAKIRETTQLFLNVHSNSPEEVYVSPLKVWNRYSQTMFLGHKFNPRTGFVKVLQDGQEVSKYYKTINDSDKHQGGQILDSWERYMLQVRMKYEEGQNIDDECDKICELMMTKDEKMLSKIKEYFTFEDYITIYDRRVGSGSVGGKSCGMLLARKIIEKERPDIYRNLEPDDSFYIGSDLFYTYIVSNDLWDLRVKQRTKEGYYKYGKELEEALKNGTDMGLKAKSYIDAGKLVPDDVVIGIIKERLAEDDCANGFILDGFPRTIPQAEALDNMGIVIDKVVDIEVPDEKITARLSGRRVCLKCGATYHLEYKKPSKDGICDVCGDELVQRKDDSPETVLDRLHVYHEQTEPLKDYYSKTGKLVIVEGQEEVKDTTALVFKALED